MQQHRCQTDADGMQVRARREGESALRRGRAGSRARWPRCRARGGPAPAPADPRSSRPTESGSAAATRRTPTSRKSVKARAAPSRSVAISASFCVPIAPPPASTRPMCSFSICTRRSSWDFARPSACRSSSSDAEPSSVSTLRRTLDMFCSKSKRSESRPPLPKSRRASAAWPRVIWTPAIASAGTRGPRRGGRLGREVRPPLPCGQDQTRDDQDPGCEAGEPGPRRFLADGGLAGAGHPPDDLGSRARQRGHAHS